MRKITRISAAIFTFSLGVSVYFVFLNLAVDKSKPLVKPLEYSSLPLMSLCDATDKAELYDSRDIRVRVYLAGKDNRGFSVFERERDCDWSSAKISFLYENGYAETDELLKQLTAQSVEGSMTNVEVEVIGKLRDESKFSSACMGRFYIEAKEVRQISPIRQSALSGSR
jgi:hypothetical protein